MAHIKDVKIGNNTYLVEPAVYAATAGTASAITAAITNFALDTGVVVTLKIINTNTSNATLNVNNTGAKAIKYNDANIAEQALKANKFYSFVYDGTAWQLISELDTDTTYTFSAGNNVNELKITPKGQLTQTITLPGIEVIRL